MLRQIRSIANSDKEFREYLAALVVSSILQAAAVITLYPLLTRLFSDHPKNAGWWVLLLVGLIVAAWLVDLYAARRGLQLGIAVMHAIQRHVPQSLLAEPSTSLPGARAAGLRTLMTQRATDATSAPVLVVGPLVSAICFTCALSIGLLWVQPLLALVTFVGGAICLGALALATRLEARASASANHAQEALQDRLFEFAWAQPSLRTARRMEASTRRVDDAIEHTRARTRRAVLSQVPDQVIFTLASQLVLIGFGFAVWWSYDHGHLGAAQAAVSVVVLLRVTEQVITYAGSVEALITLRDSLRQVADVMRVRPQPSAELVSHAPSIALRQVDVAFADGSVGLSGVDIDFAPGSVTVVVGHSGSGKTTLLRLLAGLMEPVSGSVELDGAPTTSATLRHNATEVFQQTVLHDGSVRDNLLVVRPDLTTARMDELARVSGLTTVLAQHSQGWDTPVGQLGTQLSVGERQRVGVARALAKPARLMLVDEATSALDRHNEQVVVDAIAQLKGTYTTVVVTHSPAMIEIADQVVVLDHGRVVERGSGEQLAGGSGEFARMMKQWREVAAWRV